ncbi:Bug family tripartite tricarboxylate transporter substrate binding protein [Polaromonas sp.]|uniref:Bug family tripartite tricarboxylate transporter substrate binding protein n=1 Tax=Polaromonas sp. TaxID=1869339 RepID=UPI003BAC4311
MTRFTNRRTILSALLGAAALLPLAHVQAQQPWPGKAVRIVVPFAAGGPADALARFIAIKMSADLGQPVIIDNKGGAGGTLGAAEVARSTDGYSLLFSSTGALVIVPALMPKLSYNPERDLVAIGQAVITPSVVVVSSKSRFNTLADLVAYAKANPGKLNFASAGSGTSTQLGAELLKREAGIFMTHIPYRGAAPATTDVIGGMADLMFADVPAVVSFIRGGQLKALAVASPTRSPALPDIPTTAEGGYKTVVSGTWYGLMGPAKTPPEVVAKVNASLNKVLQNPETIAFFKAQGVQSAGGSAQDFGKFIRAESIKWGTLAKAVGVSLD